MCLVYCNSEHYNTTARVIILLQVSSKNNNNILAFVPKNTNNGLHMNVNLYLAQEICNLLIDMARKFLDPSSIFQIEVP